MKTCRQLLFGILQTNFYSKIYWMLFAMITCKYKQQDLDYFEQVMKFQHYQPGDMGVAKQFWLMQQSLQDPPKKRTVDPNGKPFKVKRRPSEPKKPVGLGGDNHGEPDEEEIDYDYAVYIVSEGGTVRLDVPYFPRKSGGPAVTKVKAQRFDNNVTDALREVIDDAPTISLNVEADFYQLIDPLAGSTKLGEAQISVDSKNRLTVQLKSGGAPFVVRPNKQFSFSSGALSIGWQQKDKHYKFIFEEEYDYEAAFDQLSIWQNTLQSDGTSDADLENKDDSLFGGIKHSSGGSGDKTPESDFQEMDLLGLTDVDLADGPLSLKVSGGRRKTPKESPKDSPARPRKVNPKKTESPSEPADPLSTPLLLLPSDSQKSSPSESPIPIPKSSTNPPPSPSKEGTTPDRGRSLFDVEDDSNSAAESYEEPSEDILTFDQEPYRRAIQSLKRLSHLKSPRDKLGCILITFMDIIQCVTEFWEAHDREPVVGADDLVPIFSYVILKAKVPKLYSEMTYIWEFATDTEMKGKYGYGFATFQIGVEVITRLSLDELAKKQELELKEQQALQTPPETSPVTPETPESEKPKETVQITEPMTETGTTVVESVGDLGDDWIVS